jgi:hypothetical protein
MMNGGEPPRRDMMAVLRDRGAYPCEAHEESERWAEAYRASVWADWRVLVGILKMPPGSRS